MILLLAQPKDEKSFLFNTKYNSTSKKAIQEVQITVNKLIKLRDLNIIKVVI